jgi:hypothetical protein
MVQLYDWELSVLSHLEASQSIETVLCSPCTMRRLLCRTVKYVTSSTVQVKCLTCSAGHSPPCRSVRSDTHHHLIKIQYSLHNNKIFAHAITAVVTSTS